MDIVDKLIKTNTNFYQNNKSGEWKEPFNQATFFNFDVNAAVTINNSYVLKPAVTVGANTYPTYLEISLNVGEINDTNFLINTASATANWQIIYTQYQGVG